MWLLRIHVYVSAVDSVVISVHVVLAEYVVRYVSSASTHLHV